MKTITELQILKLIHQYRQLGYGNSWHVIKDLRKLLRP